MYTSFLSLLSSFSIDNMPFSNNYAGTLAMTQALTQHINNERGILIITQPCQQWHRPTNNNRNMNRWLYIRIQEHNYTYIHIYKYTIYLWKIILSSRCYFICHGDCNDYMVDMLKFITRFWQINKVVTKLYPRSFWSERFSIYKKISRKCSEIHV